MAMGRWFWVICDDCGQDYDSEETYADDAKQVAADAGWLVKKGTNAAKCPDCHDVDVWAIQL